jgi:oxygen-dependent protoporphyrinogen oxidase
VRRRAAHAALESGRAARAHVFNLGHGVPMNTDPAVLTDLVRTVHDWRARRSRRGDRLRRRRTRERVGADVIVVGAGVGGLVVARSRRAGRDVVVIDAAAEVGGLLRRGTLAGVDIDLGAESFATRTDAVAALVADAGLPLELVAPRPQGAWLAVATDDGVRRARLPRRTVLGIPADPEADDVVAIIGADGAARARDERRVPSPPTPSRRCTTWSPNVSVSASPIGSSTRSAGASTRDPPPRPACRSCTPVCGASSFPRLASRGRGRDRDRAAPAPPSAASQGMWRLPTALAEAAAHGAKIRTGVAVRAVRSDAETVTVETASGSLSARHVVIATGPAEAARWRLAGRGRADARPGGRRSASSRRPSPPALAAEPVGSGVIVDAALPTAAKALTHITAKWDWARAATPDGIHLVRLSARDAAAGTLATADEVAREVSILTGVDVAAADVVDLVVQEWTDAVVGAAAPDDLPAGIHLAGAAAAGTGLASVIPHARDLAARLDRALAASLPSSSLHTHPVS